MRKVLLDTSLVIRAFDPKAQDAQELIASAKEKMKALVNDPNVALAITPLIYFEALRAVEYKDIQRSQKLEGAMSQFDMVEIRQKEADLAVRLTQFANVKKSKFNKKSFDVLHWACAQVNGLEIESVDADFQAVQALYDQMKLEDQAYAKT